MAIMLIVAFGGITGMSTLWAKGLDAMAGKKGKDDPGHYWDHLDGDDDG